MTNLEALELLGKISAKAPSAETVVRVFCKRAALAHQLVSHLLTQAGV